MDNIKKAMHYIDSSMRNRDQCDTISFEEFLKLVVKKPSAVIRNAFQVFHDMIKYYVGEGVDEYPDDPESIGFVYYNCMKLFIEGSDHPFLLTDPLPTD